MAKTTYLGANVIASTDTFDEWRVRTNQLVYDAGTIIITVGAVAQPNSTNHATTTGNGHVEGIFSANTFTAVDAIRGGTVSVPTSLGLSSNIIPTSNDSYDLGSEAFQFGNTHVRNLFATGDVEANYSSDRNIKDNIRVIDQPVDIIEKLNGYIFEWKTGDHKDGKTDLGVIAQEVQEMLPFLVETNGNGNLAVKYQSLIPLLLEGIKDLSKRIKVLEESNGS